MSRHIMLAGSGAPPEAPRCESHLRIPVYLDGTARLTRILWLHLSTRQHRVAKWANATQLFFLERPPINPVPGDPLKMLESLQDTLSGKTVQRPQQNEVDLPLRSITK
jgi:hypothetical protein